MEVLGVWNNSLWIGVKHDEVILVIARLLSFIGNILNVASKLLMRNFLKVPPFVTSQANNFVGEKNESGQISNACLKCLQKHHPPWRPPTDWRHRDAIWKWYQSLDLSDGVVRRIWLHISNIIVCWWSVLYTIKALKTLFNIVEAPLKIVKLWCLCCMMMFRWPTNSQEYKRVEIHAVTIKIYYDWISPLNKRSGTPFITTQQSMGRYE